MDAIPSQVAKQKLQADDLGRLKNSSLVDCSLEVRLIADKVADEEISENHDTQTKKEYFLQIANQLKMEGNPDEKISKLTLLVIEERLALKLQKEGIPPEQAKLSVSTVRHLSRTMQEAGYTDPFYARNKKDGDGSNTKTENDFTVQNGKWLQQINMIELFCRKFKDHLKNNAFDSVIPQDEKKETLQIFNALIEDSLESINNKTKIQKYHQYLLYESYMVLNMNDLASKYSARFKDMQSMTAKQIRKILAGRCTGLLDIFNPKTTYESTRLGFSGILCDHCKSLRTVYDEVVKKGRKSVKAYCYACHSHSAVPPTRMPKPNMVAGAWRDPHG